MAVHEGGQWRPRVRTLVVCAVCVLLFLSMSAIDGTLLLGVAATIQANETAAGCGHERTLAGIDPGSLGSLLRAKAAEARKSSRGASSGPITIPIIFQVMRDSNGERGHLPYEVVANQIEHANKAFAGKQLEGEAVDTNIRFVLQAVNYWDDTELFENCETLDFTTMRLRSLQTSIVSTLNVFTCQLRTLGGWAWACYCDDRFKFPDLTGVFVDWRFMPPTGSWSGIDFGGKPQRVGDTFVHEVGHALGLLHPWYGECSVDNDFVDDTPAQKQAFGGWDVCPADVDTCPQLPGNDDVRNFMDYSDDNCRAKFTQGQADRMNLYIDSYNPTQRSMRYAWQCVARVQNTPDGVESFSLCKSSCSHGKTPNRKSAPKNGWCYYHGGNADQSSKLWGECICRGTKKFAQIPGVPQFPAAVCQKKVCAVSLTTLGGECMTSLTWKDATNFCGNMGYRLCTLKEIRSGIVRKALSASPQCSGLAKRVWAGNACKRNGRIAISKPTQRKISTACLKSGLATPVCCFKN